MPLAKFYCDKRFRFERRYGESRVALGRAIYAVALAWRALFAVDAHMKFEPRWDSKLTDMLESTLSKSQ